MKDTTGETPWHLPVLLTETIDGWHRIGGLHFVDGTVGGGGHTAALLERDPTLRVLGIDRDRESIERASATLAGYGDRVTLVQGSYADLDQHLAAAGFPAQVDGILLDLGVNSHQLNDASRGFSFLHDGPLDMRFQPDTSEFPSAADLVNQLSEKELTRIFRDWGEEPHARQAARAIVQKREERPFRRTHELRDCLHEALAHRKARRKGKGKGKGKGKSRTIDPATLCFQGLRIAVNREFEHLDRFLERFPGWLAPQGRIAIISFHSLEDRRVKRAFRGFVNGCTCPPDLPVCGCGFVPQLHILTSKPIRPTDEEVATNSRARSARLRVAEKLAPTVFDPTP